jgi:hypothetical protein
MNSKNLLRLLRWSLINLLNHGSKSNLKYFEKEQFAYGHREIFLTYLGLDKSHVFESRIHHGNTFPDEIERFFIMHDEKGKIVRQILWRNDAIPNTIKQKTNCFSIGAPILYALANLGISLPEIKKNIHRSSEFYKKPHSLKSISRSDLKILFFPSHSWEGEIMNHNSSKIFLGTLPIDRTTIILGYFDFCDPEILDFYQKSGFKVVCAGIRDSSIVDSPAGGREKFVYNLIKFIESADILVANHFTTGLLYGATLGRPGYVFPFEMELSFSSVSTHWSDNEFESGLRNYYPWMYGEKLPITNIINRVEDALGLSDFRSPSELIKILSPRKYR